jgi:hypothetical protein
MVYLVPELEATSVVGCRDEALLADVLEQMGEDIAALDDDFATADEEYSPGLTFTQAMQELFAGDFSRPGDCAFMYAYAFEMFCRYYGEFLGNRHLCPCRYRWLQMLDEVLASGGVPLRFHEMFEQLPPGLPNPRGEPLVGYWRESQLAAAQPSLEALLPSLSGDEKQALASVQEWLAKAVKQPGSIIVGFHY